VFYFILLQPLAFFSELIDYSDSVVFRIRLLSVFLHVLMLLNLTVYIFFTDDTGFSLSDRFIVSFCFALGEVFV